VVGLHKLGGSPFLSFQGISAISIRQHTNPTSEPNISRRSNNRTKVFVYYSPSGNGSAYLATMTLSSSQNDRDLPPSSLLEETCTIPSKSRDLMWGDEDEDNLYRPAYLTTGGFDYSLDNAEMWNSVMNLPKNSSPRENPLTSQNVVPESETWLVDFDLQPPPGCMGPQPFL
jgi:hypothetical protein